MDKNARGIGGVILLIVASPLAAAVTARASDGLLLPAAGLEDPPPDLIRKVAEIEAQNEKERGNYTYRQSVKIEEFGDGRARGGFYREVRDVVFLAGGERSEQFSGKPVNQLKRLVLTEEDFHDIRHIQPLMVTAAKLAMYRVRFRGDEQINGTDCWALEFQPRQILDGMRLFEGMAWVEKNSLAIIRT